MRIIDQALTKLLLMLALFSAATAKKRPPNIIFILIDDLGYNDMGYHNPSVLTPNMDRLAHSGVILERHYAQPLCTPSRAALLTGMYPYRLGRQLFVIEIDSPLGLTLDRKLLPEHLRELGYTTHIVGKWHLGHCHESYRPTHRGFDTQYGFWSGHQDPYDKTFHSNQLGKSAVDFFQDDKRVTDLRVLKRYNLDVFQDYVYKLITAKKQDERPFFLYLPLPQAHFPLPVPKEYLDLYPNEKGVRRNFSATVTRVDDAVGNLTATLKEAGLYEDTLLVVASDNGGMSTNEVDVDGDMETDIRLPLPGGAGAGGSNWPLRGEKSQVYEGGTRVPAFIHSPLLKKTG